MNSNNWFFQEVTHERSVRGGQFKGDIIPMTFADMNFKPAPEILQAIEKETQNGFFGYQTAYRGLNDEMAQTLSEIYNWKIKKEWIVWIPGVVSGLNIANLAYSNKGEKIIVNSPIYPPFFESIESKQREILDIPMKKNSEEYWELDFEQMEERITPNTKVLLFCNPHNPVGRVFSKKELEKVAKICEKYDLTIVSDDVHCDIILDENKKYTPIASLNEDIADRTITLMGPGKTYNIAGLQSAFAIIPNKTLREKFINTKQGTIPINVNNTALTATQAAYQESNIWKEKLLKHLKNNHNMVKKFFKNIPDIQLTKSEATFLSLLDVREIKNAYGLFRRNGVGLKRGEEFGAKGCLRMNFACSEATLREALIRIGQAIGKTKDEVIEVLQNNNQ